MMIKLKPNAKDLEGYLLPLYFFNGETILIEKREKTSVIEAYGITLEISNEYIIELY